MTLPSRAALDMDPSLLPDRHQLLHDALLLERDIAILREQADPVAQQGLVFYLDLDKQVAQNFQVLLVRANGRLVLEILLHEVTELHFLRRVEMAPGEVDLEVQLLAEEARFEERLSFSKGGGRDHILLRIRQAATDRAPKIVLRHEAREGWQ